MTVQDSANRLAARMARWRRAIHARPEIGLQLPRTQQMVLEALAPLGLDVRTGAGLSSVVATLRGPRPGPRILLRADMDALPIDEPPEAPHCSQVAGVMHACGHDAHTAMLLGAAHVLASMQNQLAGSVRFAFQPGEESHGGAELLVSEGVLDGVDIAFAVHVAPPLPVGLIASRPGPIMASSDTFAITLTGPGGHGSTSSDSTNAAELAARVALDLPALIGHGESNAQLSVCVINSGQTANVAPVTAHIEGTLRAFSTDSRTAARHDVEHQMACVAQQHQIQAAVQWIGPHAPLMINHGQAYRRLDQAVQHTVARRLTPIPAPIAASEDFAIIAERVPAAIAFIGAQSPHGDSGAVHTPTLRIDEGCLPVGAALLAALAMEQSA